MNVSVTNKFSVLLQKKQDKEGRFIPLAEVAEKTNIHRKTLYQWEKGIVTRYDEKVIDALCAYFEVDMGELLVYTPNEKPKKTK